MNQLEIKNHWRARDSGSTGRRLSRWMHWRINKKFAKWTGIPLRRKAELFWGDSMTVLYPEQVSGSLGRHGYFEMDMTSMMIDVLRPGMTVYDVGSHLGYFTLLASQLVDTGKVYALEPTETTYELLCENTKDYGNIECHNVAAYSESGAISFMDRGLSYSALNSLASADAIDGDCQVTQVTAVKLDEFVANRGDPDFVKIDAEGAELAILEGMREIISRRHPSIGMEMGDGVCISNGMEPCSRRIEFLMDHGYDVFDYRSGRRQRHTVRRYYEYDNLLFQYRCWKPATRSDAA